MNSTRSPSLDRSSVFFPLFFCLVSKIPLTSPARLSNISYVDKLSQLIRGGSRVPRSKRADKRTFAADESQQILAPWNTIDRLQPLRLIAFEPWFNRVYTYTGLRGFALLHVALRVPFSVSIMKIAGENRSLSSNVEWVIRTYEEEGGAFEEVLSGPVKCASLCERNGGSSHVNRISMLRQQHIYVQVARARAFSNIQGTGGPL